MLYNKLTENQFVYFARIHLGTEKMCLDHCTDMNVLLMIFAYTYALQNSCIKYYNIKIDLLILFT